MKPRVFVVMPFNRKEEYNASTPQDDANGRFAASIVGVLTALGTNSTNSGRIVARRLTQAPC